MADARNGNSMLHKFDDKQHTAERLSHDIQVKKRVKKECRSQLIAVSMYLMPIFTSKQLTIIQGQTIKY